MNTENFKHYRVFTHSPKALHQPEHYLNALGNNASVIFADTLPTPAQCLKQAQALPKTTCVFIAPNQNHQDNNQHFNITWYNSHQRIQRCGHGTLAAAHYLCNTIKASTPLVFHSTSEQLTVTIEQDRYCLQFNQTRLTASKDAMIANANRAAISDAHDGYYLIEIGNESEVKNFKLTHELIDSIKQRALIVTSLANHPQYDIVFRYFAPQYGIFEDQATGSVGPCLWAFWQDQFLDKALNCYQASARGGMFTVSKAGDSVTVSGYVTEK